MFILLFYEVALEDNILEKRGIVLSVIQLPGCHFSIHLGSLLVYPIAFELFSPSQLYMQVLYSSTLTFGVQSPEI